MIEKERNFAFIDQQNLYFELMKCGWRIDYAKFRVFLRDKYHVERAYVFIGYIKGNEDFYDMLFNAGFECIFKPVSEVSGATKGNVDAELILHALRLFHTYDKAVVVTSDGDFTCLVEYLLFHDKLAQLIIPNKDRYSKFLKNFDSQTEFLNNFEYRLKK